MGGEEDMDFKIGDYVVHKEYPKSEVVLHLTSKAEKSVINAQMKNFRHATESEVEKYHKDYAS